MSRPITYAIANQKGGTGKTAIAAALSTAAALAGHRVLMVDVDQQANLTTLARHNESTLDYAVVDTMFENPVATERAITRGVHGLPTLDLLAGDPRTASLELWLVMADYRERRLRSVLDPIANRYDYIMIDCPPNVGLMTKNALVAADRAIVPVDMTDKQAVEGAARLLTTIDALRRNDATVRIGLDRVVRTCVDEREDVYQGLNDYLQRSGLPLAETLIHDRVVWEKAGRDRVPATIWRGPRATEVRAEILALAAEIWPKTKFPLASEVLATVDRLQKTRVKEAGVAA